MRAHWFVVLIALLGVCSLSWSAEKLDLTKAEDAVFANRMVAAALEAEAKGDFAARERLLADAAHEGVADAAQWHRGMIKHGSKKAEWKSIEESMSAAINDTNLARYEKVRSQSPDTAAGHLAMAKWCQSRKLEEQARAHLNRVLALAPDHAAARSALGFVQMGDKWISPTEVERLQATAAAKTNSIQKHGKTIAALVEKMKSKSPKVRDAALAAFMAIKDIDAVGAVDTALYTTDLPTSKLLVEWMGQVDCLESSLVLTRYSVLHPEDIIREQATAKLVTRPLHDFVPEMLKMLSSPIASRVIPNYDRQGQLLGYRQAFAREGYGEKDVQIIDAKFERVQVPTTLQPPVANPRRVIRNEIEVVNADPGAAIQQQAAADVQARQLEMQRQNELIKQANSRIAAVIAAVSGKPLTDRADAMWKWWDEYNETEYQKYKPERYTTTSIVTNVAQYDTDTPNNSRTPNNSVTAECFVAGTPVITQTGPRAIETIRAGDLVLNRDLHTGALAWKPVLKATIRPSSPTVNVSIGEETLRCTGGHLFWVSGAGWKKASELLPGSILHGAKSPTRVTSVLPRPAIETYNLEVADSPNYFVGQNMLLTHDVTPRETNRQQVPGQDLLRQLTEAPALKKAASR